MLVVLSGLAMLFTLAIILIFKIKLRFPINILLLGWFQFIDTVHSLLSQELSLLSDSSGITFNALLVDTLREVRASGSALDDTSLASLSVRRESRLELPALDLLNVSLV